MPENKVKGTTDHMPIHETEYDPDADQSPLIAAACALATAQGKDPVDIDPLGDRIDGDAVKQLIQQSSTTAVKPITLEFAVEDWVVTIRSDGVIQIYDAPSTADTSSSHGRVAGD